MSNLFVSFSLSAAICFNLKGRCWGYVETTKLIHICEARSDKVPPSFLTYRSCDPAALVPLTTKLMLALARSHATYATLRSGGVLCIKQTNGPLIRQNSKHIYVSEVKRFDNLFPQTLSVMYIAYRVMRMFCFEPDPLCFTFLPLARCRPPLSRLTQVQDD